jgi:hypothetical protein
MRVKPAPSCTLPSAEITRSVKHSMALSIVPTERRAITLRAGAPPGVKADPTSTTSARGFAGARSLGACRLRAGSSLQ